MIGSAALPVALIAFSGQALDDGYAIRSQVGIVSSDLMWAQGQDPCRPTEQEATAFRAFNASRWDRVVAALKKQFGPDAAGDFGVVIPEGCRRARGNLVTRRARYERDLRQLETMLGIGKE